VKHKSVKSALVYQFLSQSCQLSIKVFSIKVFFSKHLKKHITLLTYLLPCPATRRVYQSRVHKVNDLLDIWHGLQQSAVDGAIDEERVFAPAHGPKEDILSYDNMVID